MIELLVQLLHNRNGHLSISLSMFLWPKSSKGRVLWYMFSCVNLNQARETADYQREDFIMEDRMFTQSSWTFCTNTPPISLLWKEVIFFLSIWIKHAEECFFMTLAKSVVTLDFAQAASNPYPLLPRKLDGHVHKVIRNKTGLKRDWL